MHVPLRPHSENLAHAPTEGRHLLACFDEASVVVYQAYRPTIAAYSAAHGHLGGEGFSVGRMSWIKPSFLWMMFRSGWATKESQEHVLAIHVPRALFDTILASVVPSAHDPSRFASEAEWKLALKRSEVRLQWDPDHGPSGAPLARRTIQLGLRGRMLERLANEPLGIEDITPLVVEQRDHRHSPDSLRVPIERAYPVEDPAIRAILGLTASRSP